MSSVSSTTADHRSYYCNKLYNSPDANSCSPLPEDGDLFHLLHNNTDPRPTKPEDFLLTVRQCAARLDFYLFVFLMVTEKKRISGSVKLHSWGKLETQTLRGSVIWNFSVRCIFMKWQLFFDFFIMADTNIPFPLTLRKPETQTLGESVIWNFSVWHIFMKWWPHFDFFIVAAADILFPLTLRKPETQTLGESVIWNFSIWHIYL